MKRPRRIVILCDGTSNEIETDRTNVLRLYGTLEKNERQLVYYDPGVGTFGAENSWSKNYRKALEIWGLATGHGLDHNVKEAYRFLVENYREEVCEETAEGKKTVKVPADEIYIFGFSRGAYTARVLAGFLHSVGLIKPENLNLLEYAYSAYRALSAGDEVPEVPGSRNPKENSKAEIELYGRVLSLRKPVIRCLGLFDTVGSIIEWGRFGPRLRKHLHTSQNPSVDAVRHAIAIDERRTMFQAMHWPQDDSGEQDVKEVWFSGVHGDVGGGYPEGQSGLAKLPLLWMIEETKPLGLEYNDGVIDRIVHGKKEEKEPSDKRYEPPNGKAPRNESMTIGWAALEYLPRRLPRGRPAPWRSFAGWYIPYYERRPIALGAAIHHSVFERRGTEHDYAQPNIPEDHVKV